MIVDGLFAAAELRLGDRGSERRVRIVRTEYRSRVPAHRTGDRISTDKPSVCSDHQQRERSTLSSPSPTVVEQRAAAANGQADLPPIDPDSVMNMQDRKLTTRSPQRRAEIELCL
jgi:hypothetical protein